MFYEVTILGQNVPTEKKTIELTGVATPVLVREEEEKKEMTSEDELQVRVMELKARLASLQAAAAPSAAKKNQRTGKPNATAKYVRLGVFNAKGTVPQQQSDIARILSESMEIGKEYTEAEVFEFVTSKRNDYASLRKSVQDSTYLFRYYRGLKDDGKYAGFVARDFLRVR